MIVRSFERVRDDELDMVKFFESVDEKLSVGSAVSCCVYVGLP